MQLPLKLFDDSSMKMDFSQKVFLNETFKEWKSTKKLFDSEIDKNTYEDFLKYCDGIPNTVTLVHCQDNGHIIGGFASVAWNAPEIYERVKDASAFLFSTNRKEIYQQQERKEVLAH